MYHTDDTIAAIASSPTGAARGIVRLSGPGVPAVLDACFQPAAGESLTGATRAAAVRGTITICTPRVCALEADVYSWPTARSYTRQTAAEIHTVGSPPLVSAVLEAVCAAGARPAEPGEFTLRAFLAGRLDLTQAEAVLGVIDSQGERQLQHALAQLAGNLARPLAQLRESLLDQLAHLEAGLDFVEEDIEFVTRQQLATGLDEAVSRVEAIAAQLAARGRSDTAPCVVLIGCPNVGKSSLFNALARRYAALVSAEPGTTRDYLSARLELGASSCELIDTAGHEATTGSIDAAAALRAVEQTAAADVVCLCLDSTRPANDWEHEQLAAGTAKPRLLVWTKCDAGRPPSLPQGIATSAVSAQGLDELRRAIALELAERPQDASAAELTSQRCGESLRLAGDALHRAQALVAAEQGEELIAAELRLALGELGRVAGAIYTDDILDRVFSRFCIGK